jgi:hypothetical protein
MKANYQTLDDFLDDLDAIKAKVAENTRGMTTREVVAYFARVKERWLQRTRQNKRRRSKRKISPAKS